MKLTDRPFHFHLPEGKSSVRLWGCAWSGLHLPVKNYSLDFNSFIWHRVYKNSQNLPILQLRKRNATSSSVLLLFFVPDEVKNLLRCSVPPSSSGLKFMSTPRCLLPWPLFSLGRPALCPAPPTTDPSLNHSGQSLSSISSSAIAQLSTLKNIITGLLCSLQQGFPGKERIMIITQETILTALICKNNNSEMIMAFELVLVLRQEREL